MGVSERNFRIKIVKKTHDDQVDLVAAGQTVTNNTPPLPGLRPRGNDNREVLVVLIEADEAVDVAVKARLKETNIKEEEEEDAPQHSHRCSA
jgi:hypothetical protein